MTRYKLGEIVNIKYGKDHKKLNAGRVPVYGTGGIMRYVDNYLYDGESVLIPRKGSLNNIYYVVGKFWTVDTIFWTIINKNIVLPKYLFYFLKRIDFEKLNVGSAVPSLTQKILNEIQIDVPSIEKQKDIIDKISVFERKINLNNKINTNLEKISTEFFHNWLSNTHSDKKKSLDSIANYKNGLAMQKFRPINIKESLPVVKIRELNQGHTDSNSDLCRKDIDESVQINTGDIIFSWSGTLLLDLWAGNEAGLNQHLFKVTSNDYPSWFIYEWTKYYLQEFQLIAKSKATTMGHIKRSNLKESFAIIPDDNEWIKLNNLLGPIFDNKIKIRKQNLILRQIKNQLLAKLLN
ncbi:hypothetical protein B5G14_05240 [Ligilactobacillus salivarius]|uniref:restriction endonuclease subunit S n=1 Tax=Ligilactobacillus salivarius TaxID=1624 RepID=UPI000B3AD44A|nr:restriction endonuclease subunit S [Ligilactobacillus salivarius]OUN61494.1 hypothetical protein B5G14_05240 [Ligilactobacillus salivarius]